MTRNTMIAAAAGALGGTLLVAASHWSVFGLLLGMVFSPLPLAMTAFGLGLAYLPIAVVAGAVMATALTGSFAFGAFYLVFDAAPLVILARVGIVAERAIASGVPQSVLGGRTIAMPVVVLAIVAAVLAATGLAMFPAGPDGIEASMIARFDQLGKENGMLRGMPETARAAFVSALVRVLPGATALNWCFRALASAAVGQAILARDGMNRWPTPAYRTLSVPGWYVGVFWLAVVAGWLTPGDIGFVVATLAIVLSLPLVLQGLAVVHCAAARFGYGRFALVVFYVVTLAMAGPALVPIVALGVVEHFMQLRRRMAVPNGG